MHPLEALNEPELASLVRISDLLFSARHLQGAGLRPNRQRAGTGIEFLDHRAFNPGDDSRDIDWRSTARSRHPQIRRYCNEATADWYIALDGSGSMHIGNDGKWALALQLSAALAYLLLHLGNRVSLLLFSNRVEMKIPLGRGQAHYARMLRSLRHFNKGSGEGSDPKCCYPHIDQHSAAFLISDFLAVDGMQQGLNALALRTNRLHALQIFSSQDTLLPAENSVRLKDVESEQSLTLKLGAAERERYINAYDSLCHSLSEYCHRQHIQFSRHSDNGRWKSVLIEHLQARIHMP